MFSLTGEWLLTDLTGGFKCDHVTDIIKSRQCIIMWQQYIHGVSEMHRLIALIPCSARAVANTKDGMMENRWADRLHGSCHTWCNVQHVEVTMMHCRCTTETENNFLKAYVKQVIIVSFISVELLMESLKSLRLFCETSTHPGRKELKLEQ